LQIGIFQTARMEQRLLQSPQMIQAMQILQLSSLDLQDRIEQELLENPLLERADAPNDTTVVEGEARATETTGELGAIDAVLAMREHDRWDPMLRRRRGTLEEADRKHEAMQNSPAAYRSLGQALLSQVALIELDARQRAMLEFLVFSLDARGYLPRPLSDLLEECAIEGATEAEFALLLEELRHATHPSLGARDLRECLLLQAGRMAVDHPLLGRLIAENLADVAANRLPHIARATGHSLEEVLEAIELLRTLDPCPGSAYGEFPAEVIRPELVVEEIDGAFHVRLARDGMPELTINADYTKLLRDAPRGDAARKWVTQRLGSARWFMDALAQRQSTLLRIGKALFERQAAFLDKGARALHPLRMAEVAEATGVHLSTVSRAVAGKYVQTPHGILALRSFFCGGTAKASGGVASQNSIQQRVKELVEEEDPSTPLSDDRLAELLSERDGIRLARRTITKYRKVLAISCASRRRVF
jgi:RNA polymerase sigma-54 factor